MDQGTAAHRAIQWRQTSSADSGQPADGAAYAAASGGWTSWPPSWKYDVISKNPTPSIDA